MVNSDIFSKAQSSELSPCDVHERKDVEEDESVDSKASFNDE